MGVRDIIRQQVDTLVISNGTNNPFEIAKSHKITVDRQSMGSIVLGYFTNFYDVPIITISNQLNDVECRYVCAHELGHYFCHHTDNVYCLNLNMVQQSYVNTSRSEAEAHFFATELALSSVDFSECQTQQEILYQAGIPYWAAKYIDWVALQPQILHSKGVML